MLEVNKHNVEFVLWDTSGEYTEFLRKSAQLNMREAVFSGGANCGSPPTRGAGQGRGASGREERKKEATAGV